MTSNSVGEPTIEVRRLEQETALIVLCGEHDLASARDLQAAIDESLESVSHLIIDISDTEFIDSSTIAVFVRSKERAEASGARFNLVLGTAAIVERALEVSGVLPVLNVVPSLEQALAD